MASSQMKNDYHQLGVPPQKTMLLYQVQKDIDRCPHHYKSIYPSPSDYIRHVLWMLHGIQYHLEHRKNELNAYFRKQMEIHEDRLTCYFCTNCCNLFLSALSISEMIDISRTSEYVLNGNFMVCLFWNHPQMIRVAVKECPMTSISVNGGNNLITSITENIIKFVDKAETMNQTLPNEFLYFLVVHISIIAGSMKYWNEHHYGHSFR